MSLSPLPDVGLVTRETPRDDEDCIDAKRVSRTHETGRQPLGGYRHPAEPVGVEGECCIVIGRPRLDLDEG